MTQVQVKRAGKRIGAKRRVANDAGAFPSLNAAARYVSMSRPTFTKEVLPLIPHRRVGNRVLISKTVLDRWLEGHDAAPDEAK